MGYRASTRIRTFQRDEDGTVLERHGIVELRKFGKFYVKDVSTGFWVLLDSFRAWEAMGKPHDVVYRLGFSLAGQRGVVVRPWTRATAQVPV
jgi:hypothetical protein